MFLSRPVMVAAIACVIAGVSGGGASAQELQRLAGMWIAIDDGFPRLVGAGLIVPTEEILAIAPDGNAQSRLLTITGFETHYMCATGWGCSDMLPVREAKAELTGGALVFRNRETTAQAQKITRDTQLLAAGLTLIAASPQWVVSFEADGRRARFESGSTTRIFAKIDPDHLNRLRAAPMALEISYATHWRCFLSNATAGDRAFDPVGGPRRAPGAWFADFLPAAAEFHRLAILTGAPAADDDLAKSDPDWARAATMQVTHSMIGDLPFSGSAGKLRYRAPLVALSVMMKLDDPKAAMEAARKLDPAFAGISTVSPAGVKALQKVGRAQQSGDAEVRDLFCLDRKDAPQPRPGFDPFRGVPLPK